MSWPRKAVCGLACFVASVVARDAAAFCQATGCDPATSQCSVDSQGCVAEGLPLWWPSSCVTVSVQADGAPTQNIGYDDAKASVTRAFSAWMGAACIGGGSPSIHVEVNGPVKCGASEYNSSASNANIVVFREDSWPYAGGQDALGLTRIHFDPQSGEIWDSDIEVNAVDEKLSVGDPQPDSVDLDSLLTHEAGHLLGLGHTTDDTATMFPGYHRGSIELRSLAADDVQGICEIYPPNRKASVTSCEPRHGFSELCGAEQPPIQQTPDPTSSATSGGCSSVAAAPTPSGLTAALIVSLAALAARRKRRPAVAKS